MRYTVKRGAIRSGAVGPYRRSSTLVGRSGITKIPKKTAPPCIEGVKMVGIPSPDSERS